MRRKYFIFKTARTYCHTFQWPQNWSKDKKFDKYFSPIMWLSYNNNSQDRIYVCHVMPGLEFPNMFKQDVAELMEL